MANYNYGEIKGSELYEAFLRIREGMHIAVNKAVDDAECIDRIHIWGDRGNERKMKPVVMVKSQPLALKLDADIKAAVEDANERARELAEANGRDPFLFRYKVRVLHADGDVLLSSKEAESRERISGVKAIGLIKAEIDKSKSPRELDALHSGLALIVPGADYLMGHSTGRSYRLTYYDPMAKRRRQRSVGDVSIIFNDNTRAKIRGQGGQKERSDKRDPLFGFYITDSKGGWGRYFNLYEVIP